MLRFTSSWFSSKTNPFSSMIGISSIYFGEIFSLLLFFSVMTIYVPTYVIIMRKRRISMRCLTAIAKINWIIMLSAPISMIITFNPSLSYDLLSVFIMYPLLMQLAKTARCVRLHLWINRRRENFKQSSYLCSLVSLLSKICHRIVNIRSPRILTYHRRIVRYAWTMDRRAWAV